MKVIFVALLSLMAGAATAWAVCVFILQLPWETSLLIIEIIAVLSCLASVAVLRGRRRKTSG